MNIHDYDLKKLERQRTLQLFIQNRQFLSKNHWRIVLIVDYTQKDEHNTA